MGIATPRGTGGLFTSTSYSWSQAGRAAWCHADGIGQLWVWRGGQRRAQDCREYSRFGRARRGARFCS
eukprot:3792993-Amphidinium_carterae.1